MNNINHKLDNPSLLLIFDRLSVEALLRAGRVCLRWNELRRKSARTRKSLKLLIGNARLAVKAIEFSRFHFVLNGDNAKRYVANMPFHEKKKTKKRLLATKEFNQMHVKSLSEFGVQFLFELFPNVRTLTTSLRSRAKDINPIIALLELLSPLLTTLKLYTYNKSIFPTFNLRTNKRLLSTVNSMPSLRVLHFDLKSELNADMHDRIELPILGQLEQFYFNTNDDSSGQSLVESFKRFGDGNARLKEIVLTCLVRFIEYEYEDADYEFLDIPPALDKCFTQIEVIHFGTDELASFEEMCSRFTNLTILKIVIESVVGESLDLFAFYRSLAQLRQLVSLHGEFALNELCFNDQMEQQLEQELGALVNISVQSLSITLPTRFSDHYQFYWMKLQRLYPKLQLFSFEQYLDRQCQLCAKDRPKHDLCLIRMSKMLFRSNAHLQTIVCPPNVWTRAKLINFDEDNSYDYSTTDSESDSVDDEYDEDSSNDYSTTDSSSDSDDDEYDEN